MARRYSLSELPSHEEVLEEDLKDPRFRAEWERTALARAVALLVLRYRSEHELSQTALAKRLGVSQPAVARLEASDHNPTIETLIRLASVLDLELAVDIAPNSRPARLVNEKAAGRELQRFRIGNASVLVAAT
jgi:DNA-binding XRE family transcriptional regulator